MCAEVPDQARPGQIRATANLFMLWTLQKYILRELGRTFILTALTLTVILSMGVGAMKMFQLQQVTVAQLWGILKIVLPISGSLALPMAALFSAAVTYGRISADNEFVACRSSGINIHRLFFPTVLISLVSAGVTFYAINYAIPDQIRQIDQFFRTDLAKIAQYQLQAPGRLPLAGDRYRVFADNVTELSATEGSGSAGDDAADREKGLILGGVAFVEMDRGQWIRYGTAETVRVQFGEDDEQAVVQADFFNLDLYDVKKRRWNSHAHESIAPYRIPKRFKLKVKWLTLSELWYYRQRPMDLPEVRDDLEAVRSKLAEIEFHESLAADWKAGRGQFTIGIGEDRCFVRAGGITEAHPHTGERSLEDVEVQETVDGELRRTARAERAAIRLLPHDPDEPNRWEAYLELYDDVRITDLRDPHSVVIRNSERFVPVVVAPRRFKELQKYSDHDLLDPDLAPQSNRKDFVRKRSSAIAGFQRVGRDITRNIHFRLALSLSVFVLTILGAALGIHFRGAHALTAFGVSFIPALVVCATIIMGRLVAQNEGMTSLGVGIIWTGIVLVVLVDVWVLTRVVRR